MCIRDSIGRVRPCRRHADVTFVHTQQNNKNSIHALAAEVAKAMTSPTLKSATQQKKRAKIPKCHWAEWVLQMSSRYGFYKSRADMGSIICILRCWFQIQPLNFCLRSGFQIQPWFSICIQRVWIFWKQRDRYFEMLISNPAWNFNLDTARFGLKPYPWEAWAPSDFMHVQNLCIEQFKTT